MLLVTYDNERLADCILSSAPRGCMQLPTLHLKKEKNSIGGF